MSGPLLESVSSGSFANFAAIRRSHDSRSDSASFGGIARKL
jgi:hypothetical protein